MAMTRTHKILLGVAAGLCLLFGSLAYATYHVVARHGMLAIDVTEKTPGGARIKLLVPGVLVNLGLSLVPTVMPPDERERLSEELARFEPLLAAVVDELEKAPDMVFVEVEDGHERVTIAKRDGHLVIDVETDREDVRVAVPVESVRATWEHVLAPVS
ncbi:MAG: hypothetical protein HYU52_03880 [Acidobacteria bacterium]|nr:hypothetical protein [Acidobacteriota bacterium]